jgi:hypothetical protein
MQLFKSINTSIFAPFQNDCLFSYKINTFDRLGMAKN